MPGTLAGKFIAAYPWRRLFGMAQTGSLSLVSQGVTSATNFLSGIIIARLCSKEQFGLYALSLSIVLFLNEFQNALITMPYMIYSPRTGGNDRREYTGSALVQQFTFSFSASLLLLLSSVIASRGFGPGGLAEVLRVLALFTVFITLKDFARQFSFATLRPRTALLLDLCAAVVQIGSLWLLFRLGSLSASGSFVAIGVACGVASTVWLVFNRGFFLPKYVRVLPDFLRNWRPARWIIASHLLWTLAMSLYPWLIGAFHGITANAVWGACVGAAALGNVILLGAQNVTGPRILYAFAKGGVAGMKEFVWASSKLLMLIMSGVSVFYLVFGNNLLVLFYGNAYKGDGLTVFVLTLNLIIGSLSFALGRGLFAMERADMECLINAISALALFALGIWFVRALGPLGAGLGLLVTSVISGAVRIAVFRRVTDRLLSE
jgi:O-antigen/teichoic acid export membrane protein